MQWIHRVENCGQVQKHAVRGAAGFGSPPHKSRSPLSSGTSTMLAQVLCISSMLLLPVQPCSIFSTADPQRAEHKRKSWLKSLLSISRSCSASTRLLFSLSMQQEHKSVRTQEHIWNSWFPFSALFCISSMLLLPMQLCSLFNTLSGVASRSC